MASVALGGRVGRSSATVALRDECEQRREFHDALLEADTFEDLSGKWQAAILKAGQGHRGCGSSAALT